MTGDSGLMIGDERIGDPRTSAPKVYGGREAKVIRRRDGRIGVVDAHSGVPLGLLISDEEAAQREADSAELPALEDDGLGAIRSLALAAFIGLVLIASAYACFHVGRSYQRSLDESPRFTR